MKLLNCLALAWALLIPVAGIAENASTQQPPTQAQMEALMTPKTLKIDSRPLPLSGSHLFIVEVKVEGVPAKMLVDTGASHTTLDLNWVRKQFPNARVQLVPVGGSGGPYGFAQNSVPLMPLERFEIGGNRFADFLTPLVDLSGLRMALPELKEVVGVLGMNTLGAAPCRIAFNKRTIQWLTQEELAKIGKKEKLRTSLRSGSPCAMVHVASPKNGQELPLLLDCGAVVTCVPAAFWTAARPEKQKSRITTAAGVRDVEIAFGVPENLRLTPDFAAKGISPQLLPPEAPPKYLLGTDVLAQTDLLFVPESASVFVISEK